LLALALCAVGIVVTVLGRIAGGPRQEQQKRTALESGAEAEAYPAFSPDGRRLAYSARERAGGAATHIFTRPAGGGSPVQLTTGPGADIGPSWSPDGSTIAFVRSQEESAACMTVPSGGGAARKIADCHAPVNAGQFLPAVAWTPNGRALIASTQSAPEEAPALSSISRETGAVKAITRPPKGTEGDFTPAISPAGDTIAFVRATGSDTADVYLCDLAGGNLRRVTFDDRAIRGIAWTADGESIVYAANRSSGWRLWRIPAAGGTQKELRAGGKQAQFPAIARQGTRLAFTDSPSVAAIWRATLGNDEDAQEDRPLIRSSGRETGPAYSPDGTKIASISDQTASEEVWVSSAEGRERSQLTHFKTFRLWPPRWSPDGKALLVEARGDHSSEVYRIAADGRGEAVRVVLGSNASWAHDSKSIYYLSRGQIWKAAPDGANPRPVTTEPGAGPPEESPDGKSVFFRYRRALFQAPSNGGEAREVTSSDQRMVWNSLRAGKTGLYYLASIEGERTMLVSFLDLATMKSRVVFRARNAEWGGRATFSISPDERYVLYSRLDQNSTGIVLVDNFE
jgi:Tol biopolymer transport system component